MNPIIITGFLMMTLISFGIIMFIMRPTQEEKMMRKRLITLADKNAEIAAAAGLETMLVRKKDTNFDWMEGLFDALSVSLSQKLRMLILQANVHKSPGTIMIYCLASALGGGFLAFVFIPFPYVFLLVGLVAASFPIPIGLLKFKRARRMKSLQQGSCGRHRHDGALITRGAFHCGRARHFGGTRPRPCS